MSRKPLTAATISKISTRPIAPRPAAPIRDGARHANGTAAAYQETIPAPPAVDAHGAWHSRTDGRSRPGDGTRPDDLARPDGSRRSDGRRPDERSHAWRLRFVRRLRLRRLRSVRRLLRRISMPPGVRTGRCSASVRRAFGSRPIICLWTESGTHVPALVTRVRPTTRTPALRPAGHDRPLRRRHDQRRGPQRLPLPGRFVDEPLLHVRFRGRIPHSWATSRATTTNGPTAIRCSPGRSTMPR